MDKHSIVRGRVVAENKDVDPNFDEEKLVRGGVLAQGGWCIEIADGDVGGSLC